MSWIFSVYGKFTKEEELFFENIHPEPLCKISKPGLYIAAGGISETCFYNYNEETKQGFVVSGSGIKRNDLHFSFIETAQWNELLQKENFSIEEIDGCYTGIRWDDKNLIAFVDQLGGRNMYISSKNEYTILSTRLDMITKLNSKVSIIPEEAFSMYLFSNQFSQNCILSGVTRLSTGGKAVINKESTKVTHKPWSPEPVPANEEKTVEILKSITLFPSENNKKITLSLSGGADSRILLSFLLSSPGINWEACTFGSDSLPDSVMAKKLSDDFKFSFRHYNAPLPSPDESLKQTREFVKYMMLSEEASHFIMKRYYPSVFNGNNVIIDGGFAELLRRGLFNRMLFDARRLGIPGALKKMLAVNDYEKYNYMSEDLFSSLQKGVSKIPGKILDEMPPVSNYSIEAWLDLLAMRYKYPSVHSPEQTRSDSVCIVFTPFSNKYLLNHVFALPPEVKRNNKLVKKIIESNAPDLKKYPFAKHEMFVPYYLPTFPAKIYAGLRKKIGLVVHDDIIHDYLYSMKSIILDFINSSEVKNSSLYNWKNISTMAQSYYSGNESSSNKLDKWLTLEIFRQEFGL